MVNRWLENSPIPYRIRQIRPELESLLLIRAQRPLQSGQPNHDGRSARIRQSGQYLKLALPLLSPTLPTGRTLPDAKFARRTILPNPLKLFFTSVKHPEVDKIVEGIPSKIRSISMSDGRALY